MRISTTWALLISLGAASGLACEKHEKSPAEEKKQPDATPSVVEQKPAGHPVDSLTFPKMSEMTFPEDNPQTDEKVALGHKLFFEKRLSVDGSLSCYSCHQNEDGNGGKDPVAIGAQGKKLTRHSPVIWNVGYLPAFYWDGRSPTLEAQAKGAWGGGNMGVGADNLDAKAKEIAALPEYKEMFEKAFPGKSASGDLVAQALSAYERTLICNDTSYDKYAAGDKAALSQEQKDGLEIFMGKAMCSACHAPPFFSTAFLGQGTYFNVGVGISGVEEKDVDVGRMAVTKDEKDWAAFKPPSLRHITKSAPYFHDGHTADLKEAVKFMASGGIDNKNKSPLMSDKKLSDEEINKLVIFLGALECGGKLTPP
jgi:cytochrome c peroxidase